MNLRLASFPGLSWSQFLMLQTTKNWGQGRPGNEANLKCIMNVACEIIVTTCLQDAHKRLVLQVYLGSNTLEFSAVRR